MCCSVFMPTLYIFGFQKIINFAPFKVTENVGRNSSMMAKVISLGVWKSQIGQMTKLKKEKVHHLRLEELDLFEYFYEGNSIFIYFLILELCAAKRNAVKHQQAWAPQIWINGECCSSVSRFFSCYSACKIIFLSLFNSFISLTCQVCCLLTGTYYVFSCCFMLSSIAVVWGVHSFVEMFFSSSL